MIPKRRRPVPPFPGLLLAALWLVSCATSKRLGPCADYTGDACECGPEAVCVPTGHDAGAVDHVDARADADHADDAWLTAEPPLNICNEVTLAAERIVPNILLVIDQSISMADPFGDEGSRWTGLKEALVGAGGLIPKFQDRVRFGVSLYSATKRPIGGCPLITSVDATEGNLETIRTVYDTAQPLENAPTGAAIDAVIDDLIASRRLDSGGFQDAAAPTILILATDGEPDGCEALDPQTGQAEAVSAMQRAFSLGVRTFVVAMAEEEALSREHLRDMANAGMGVVAGEPDAPSFRVQDQTGLRQALLDLVTGELSCEVDAGWPPDLLLDPCSILVDLDGKALSCDHPDGWRRANGSRRLQLLGRACSRFKAGGSLHLQIPCTDLKPL